VQTASGYAPGRVELLGNHTDYNEGVVLAAAIDRGVTVRGTSRADGIIVLKSELLKSRVEIQEGERRPLPNAAWANYPLGVVQQFELAGHRIAGFEATVAGDVPTGAGLSSSAALEVATAGFLMSLQGIRLDPMMVAKLCRRAENEFVGVRSGLLDQATSIFGRANHTVHLDFRTEQIRTIPLPNNVSLVIADSGAKHQLVQSEYNTRRDECAAAAKALGARSLREVSPSRLEATRGSLAPVLYRRAAHIVGENERVSRAVEALEQGDAETFGSLMNASHESSRTNFENSSPELDRLVAIARSLPGVFGSRLTGGGFGGGTVTLAKAETAVEIARELARHSPFAFVCQTADGAAVTWPNSSKYLAPIPANRDA
jgi:galactokinase